MEDVTEANATIKLENVDADVSVKSEVQCSSTSNITSEMIIKEEHSDLAYPVQNRPVDIANVKIEQSYEDVDVLSDCKKYSNPSGATEHADVVVDSMKQTLNDVVISVNPSCVELVLKEEELPVEYFITEAKDPLDTSELNVNSPQQDRENSSINDLANIGSSDFAESRQPHCAKKIHTCDLCGKIFPYRIGLERHKRVHTGEKPFVCDVCNRKFAQSYHMVKHKQIHTGDKPYICEVCSKRFYGKSDLTKHKRIHSGLKPYACDVCNKHFRETGQLVKHKRIHTDDKPYVCSVCNNRYTSNGDLVKHSLIHTGIKPYECDMCGKSFSFRCVLLRHVRLIHTGKKPDV